MSDQTVEFAGRSWKRSGGVWVTAWQPPQDLNLRFQGSVRIVGHSQFDDLGNETDEPAAVSAEQQAAAAYLFEHPSQICREVLRQLLRYCRRLHQEDPQFFDELAGVETVDQLTPQIGELQVAIEYHSADGCAWMSITGGCDWEIEHGLGICVWQDIVLDIGTYDTVLGGPDAEYTSLPPLEDSGREQTRQSVLNTLAAISADEAEAAEQAALNDLPDSVRLCFALAGGDAAVVDQLVAKGVRLHNFPKPYQPPVFMAIQSCDPGLLKRMMELGARTDVTGLDGQTPIAQAREMLAGFRLSQDLQNSVLGDLSAMADREQPSTGGLMSMLGHLQNEAAGLLSQLADQQHQPPAWDDDRVSDHRGNIENAAAEVNEMIPKLEQIMQILSAR
jgi:hypothetical protein